jgi:uncharacterized protein DUF4432
MSRDHCHLREFKLDRGYRAVALENQYLSITLLPEKGADIYSLVYKPRKMDVLWKSPWGLKRPGTGITMAGSSTEAAWMDHYEGGWQEIFPNGGDDCIYKGAPLCFHGEASILPWDYTVLHRSGSRITVEFSVRLYRSPFSLRRCVTVERNLPAVLFEEKLINEGEEDMHFMWGHHPAYGLSFLSGDCRLQVHARTYQEHDTELSPTSRIPAGCSGAWPMVVGKNGQAIDLSIIPRTEDRVSELGYLCDLEDGWYGLTNQKEGFGVGLAWPKEVFKYLWFWRELRGSFGYPWYGTCYVAAVEPFTSVPGSGLAKAIEKGTSPVLAAGSSLQVHLAAAFFEAEGELENISTEGIVKQRP